MKKSSTFIVVALIVSISSANLYADVIPSVVPTEERRDSAAVQSCTEKGASPEIASTSVAGLSGRDVAFIVENPNSIQYAGQNTWYENTTGFLWLLSTVVVIIVIAAAS